MSQLRFESVPIAENNEPLVSVSDYLFVAEPAYFNQGIAPDDSMKIRKDIAEKLLATQENFDGAYQFKIWDGYRPRSVQDAIYNDYWKKIESEHPDWNDEQLNHEVEKFVTRATSLERIPPHATGGAIDLTLVDHEGNELNMGTEFDHFGPESFPDYYDDKDKTIAANRALLRTALLDAGFTPDSDEWWHFDYGNQSWALRSGQQAALYGEVAQ